ncbi:transmembrane protein 61 [Protopterus annectens]|uniref:transmembrane protein 61 n=1 Tax=Protopterus annectens TaxID=7888 RepID=UPI001CF9978F|nr:transmembrane protein 61 [Protopterus annectens]
MTSSFRYGVTITGTILLVTGTLCFAWWSDGEASMGTPEKFQAKTRAGAETTSNSPAFLRSVSFFCIGIGGVLLLFGLLWSVKVNAKTVSHSYHYHSGTSHHHLNIEASKSRRYSVGKTYKIPKRQTQIPETRNMERSRSTLSISESDRVPTYEEALLCRPIISIIPSLTLLPTYEENFVIQSQQMETNNQEAFISRMRSFSDSVLLRKSSSEPNTAQETTQTGGITPTYSTPPPSYENIPIYDV